MTLHRLRPARPAQALLRPALLLLLGVGLYACQSLSQSPEPPAPTGAPAPRPGGAQPPPFAREASAVRPGAGATALLLPLTGRQAGAGASVRDGFMTAWYRLPGPERPPLRVYDTGPGVAAALHAALEDGAALVVGPLTREDVVQAAALPGQRVPMLVLNYLPAGQVAPPQFLQFALSPEDEARQVARRAIAEGRRRAVVIAPNGEWGTRVLAAFRQELDAAGGTVLASVSFDPELTDLSEPIMQALRLTESRNRHARLEALLGTKLQFEPRRRGDIDFIFAPAPAATERLLRPQLRFHYAGAIPTYATSDAFEPDPRANQELDGLRLPDMPWMLGSALAEAVRTAAQDAWDGGGVRRGRLFAFGYDAERLAELLRVGGTSTPTTLDGLTGKLDLVGNRIQRTPGWAQLRNGELHALGETAAD